MSSRREFITLLGGAAAWPLRARAQFASEIAPSMTHGQFAAVLGLRASELTAEERRRGDGQK